MKNFLDASKFAGEECDYASDAYDLADYHKTIEEAISAFRKYQEEYEETGDECCLIILYDKENDELLFRVCSTGGFGVDTTIQDLNNFEDWFEEEWVIVV